MGTGLTRPIAHLFGRARSLRLSRLDFLGPFNYWAGPHPLRFNPGPQYFVTVNP